MSPFSRLLASAVPSLTSSFSVTFLGIFLPLSIIIYAILPQKWKKWFLIAASYTFFWLISGKLIVFLLISTFSIHYTGIWLDTIQKTRDEKIKEVEKEQRKAIKKEYIIKQRYVVLLAVVINIGCLLILKYTTFFGTNINTLFSLIHIPIIFEIPKFVMPIGISFYTLQAVSYVLDVYRGTIKADYNLGRLALFMSFFPQIVEGPICRYSQTAERLWSCPNITYKNLTYGLQRVLFGLMKKVVIADRLNSFVSSVFNSYGSYSGMIIFIGAVCYTIQLYMDFSGSMDAVMGVAEIFGVKMPENFNQPFFSKSISEFWKRWHITLGTWLRDYIFYPVTMSKPMKNITSSARKKIGNHFGPLIASSIALFLVWIANGLWHGAAWNFIFFGMYHFVLILCGNIFLPTSTKIKGFLHIKNDSFPYKIFQIIRTGILVVIGELFFRANGVAAGFSMFTKIVTNFSLPKNSTDLFIGIDIYDIAIVGIALLIVFAVGIMREKGISVRDSLAAKNIVLRWCILYALIMFIVIFGAYGAGYVAVDPMYANY